MTAQAHNTLHTNPNPVIPCQQASGDGDAAPRSVHRQNPPPPPPMASSSFTGSAPSSRSSPRRLLVHRHRRTGRPPHLARRHSPSVNGEPTTDEPATRDNDAACSVLGIQWSVQKQILVFLAFLLPPLSDLAKPEEKLAGLRIDGSSNTRSRMSFYTGIVIHKLLEDGTSGPEKEVQRYPEFSGGDDVLAMPECSTYWSKLPISLQWTVHGQALL